MADKKIQVHFGQAMIDAFEAFAKKDIPTVAALEDDLAHVDVALRPTLARTLFGTRWMYKLGVAALVGGDERVAHIRAQLIDYGSMAEALLSDAVRHGIARGHLIGHAFRHSNPPTNTKALTWAGANVATEIRRRTFNWLILVAEEEGIVTPQLAKRLHSLRTLRNGVHLVELAAKNIAYTLKTAKKAHTTLSLTLNATRTWVTAHP